MLSGSNRLFGIVLYLGLLGGGVIFVKQTVIEFIKGDTSYTEEIKQVTLHDLPTILICLDFERDDDYFADNSMSEELSLFPLTFGTDVTINATFFEKHNETVNLLENQDIQTSFGINIRLSKMTVTRKGKWECYKFSTKTREDVQVDIEDFKMQLVFSFPTANNSMWKAMDNHGFDVTGMPIYTYVVATSEQNSYGMTQGKWFDGKMEIFNIIRDQYYNWDWYYELQVTNIDEVVNLDYTCSHDSYYECLAKRYRKFDFKTAPTLVVNGSKCYMDQLCTPYSLPSNDEDKIPICTNEIDQACYGHILSKLDSEQTEYCKKSCHVKEYSFKKSKNYWDNGEIRLGVMKELKKRQLLIINLSYDLVSQYTRELRALKPYKTVKREYWIMSGLSFVGNVGGTLGMFVGFSFIGTSEWFFELLTTFWTWLQRTFA